MMVSIAIDHVDHSLLFVMRLIFADGFGESASYIYEDNGRRTNQMMLMDHLYISHEALHERKNRTAMRYV